MTSFVRQIIGFSRWTGVEDLRRRSAVGAQITMLNEIGRAMSTSMVSVEKTHELIAEAVCAVLGVEKAFVCLLDERNGVLVPRAGRGLVGGDSFKSLRIPKDADAVIARALASTTVLRGIAESESDPAAGYSRALSLGHYLAAPMQVESRGKGVLVADSKVGGREFEADDERLLMVLAYLAAIAGENADRVQNLKDKTQRLAALLEVGRALNSTLDLEGLLDRIVEKALEITGANTGAILLLDESREYLTIQASRGIQPDVVKRLKLRLGEGITGTAAKESRTILVPDVTKEARYVVANPAVRSELAVPMYDVDGRTVLGVVDVDSDIPDNFREDDRELLQTFAGIAAIAIRNARLFAEEKSRS